MDLLYAVGFVSICILVIFGIGVVVSKIMSKLINDKVGKLLGRATFTILLVLLLYYTYLDLSRFEII